jgi:hypothetical protein
MASRIDLGTGFNIDMTFPYQDMKGSWASLGPEDIFPFLFWVPQKTAGQRSRPGSLLPVPACL